MGAAGRPTPVGPYAPVVRAGAWVVCSGQLGLVDDAPAAGVAEQVRLALANIERLLADKGATLAHVVKTTVFLTDMADFAEMNTAYLAALGDHRPARSAVAVVALPRGARVEIEAWAHVPEERPDR